MVIKYSFVVDRYPDATSAILWLYNNVPIPNWNAYPADHGIQFIFKNEADATWFALVHGDKLV